MKCCLITLIASLVMLFCIKLKEKTNLKNESKFIPPVPAKIRVASNCPLTLLLNQIPIPPVFKDENLANNLYYDNGSYMNYKFGSDNSMDQQIVRNTFQMTGNASSDKTGVDLTNYIVYYYEYVVLVSPEYTLSFIPDTEHALGTTNTKTDGSAQSLNGATLTPWIIAVGEVISPIGVTLRFYTNVYWLCNFLPVTAEASHRVYSFPQYAKIIKPRQFSAEYQFVLLLPKFELMVSFNLNLSGGISVWVKDQLEIVKISNENICMDNSGFWYIVHHYSVTVKSGDRIELGGSCKEHETPAFDAAVVKIRGGIMAKIDYYHEESGKMRTTYTHKGWKTGSGIDEFAQEVGVFRRPPFSELTEPDELKSGMYIWKKGQPNSCTVWMILE